MSETETKPQDGQKTIVSFIVGLLIGGLLVWVFSSPTTEDMPTDETGDTDTEMVDDSSDEEANDSDADADDSNDDTASEADSEPAAPQLEVGDGSVEVSNQAAGETVALDGAVYPVEEGWIGVRGYDNERLTSLLGVVRFSESQGLVPDNIILQAPTQPGREYAIVIYRENGDFEFSLANDVQIDEVYATFTAQ